MHPKKSWEWRDFPVQVRLPETLSGGWKQLSHDTAGEAGLAVFLGCQLTNLNRGLELARGWDGDRAGLFERAGGKHLLLWASAWDSAEAAARCAKGFIRQRERAHEAVVSLATNSTAQRYSVSWQRPDGRRGLILSRGKHLIVLETDDPESLIEPDRIAAAITFIEPPEDAARAAINRPLLRVNPFL